MSESTVDLAEYFDYLCLARERLFAWIAGLPAEAYARAFPFGRGSIRATLIHVADAQRGYTSRLEGSEYSAAENPFTAERLPDLGSLKDAWSTLNPLTRRAMAALGNGSREILYASRVLSPGKRLRGTAGGVASQLLFHEVHHRAQVMTMLRHFGVAAENLDYNNLMFDRVD
ncbi:MAG TPA: DinB family protein [bacterium]|nr:DinB family protein [bacterium]